MNMTNKIIIGTANLGKKYGYKKKGFLNEKNLARIISLTKKSRKKIFFDTAQAYGSAENILGKYLRNVNVNIIKKVSISKKEFLNYNIVKKDIISSIKYLKTKKLYCLMVHNTNVLKNKKKLNIVCEIFERLKKEKIILNKGISVYDVKDFKHLYKSFDPDIIQIPLNVFDQRFIRNKWIQRFLRDKKEVHLRSIFLQGLLLENKVPKKFSKFKFEFKIWFSWLKKNKFSNFDACLNFVLNQKINFKLVVGVDNFKHFKQIINFNGLKKNLDFENFASNKKKLIDPRTWN